MNSNSTLDLTKQKKRIGELEERLFEISQADSKIKKNEKEKKVYRTQNAAKESNMPSGNPRRERQSNREAMMGTNF